MEKLWMSQEEIQFIQSALLLYRANGLDDDKYELALKIGAYLNTKEGAVISAPKKL
jgi:hypothetical protein